MIYAAVALLAFALVPAWLAYTRSRQYKYNPCNDYLYRFSEGGVESPISELDRIDLRGESTGTTLVLRLKGRSLLSGRLFQPFAEIVSEEGGCQERHYFEHGFRGERYLDLSGFAGKIAKLRLRHCTFVEKTGGMFRFADQAVASRTVLVLAPHADDAEIAAYGLYSDASSSYVVTVTAGEEGKSDYCGLYDSKRDKSLQKAKLRAHDALCVPLLGGVLQERCAVLGYFGKSLKWMHDHRTNKAISTASGIEDVRVFRHTAHTAFLDDEGAEATWDSLVRDMRRLLDEVKPGIVVTPHVDIDSHSDHVYTTLALQEALEGSSWSPSKLLCYTNHHLYNEAYPYGPIASVSLLAPKFDTPLAIDGIYSHRLDRLRQNEKFYALEAMHDLRDAMLVIGVKKAWKHFVKQFKRAWQQRDKSYYRRAVRPNELFYVVDLEGSSNRSK